MSFKETTSGFKFGLNIPAKKLQTPLVKSPLFKDDDEPVLDMNAALVMDAQKRKQQKKNVEHQKKLLLEDPTVYDYDGVYDAMQRDRGDRLSRIQQAKEEERKKPKYISAIKNRAEQRKVEQDIIYDKLQRKEQEKEAGEFGDLPKYVSKSWKEKLIQDKLWLENEEKRLAEEEDVTKKEDLTDFFTGLLTKNVSMGAETEKEKESRLKAEQEKVEEEKHKKEEERKLEEEKTLPEEELLRRQIRRELVEQEKQQKEKSEEELSKEKEGRRKRRAEEDEKKLRQEEEEEEMKKQKQEEQEKFKFAKRNDEVSIADAKTRYLERKKQREQQ